jgi:hypothetical protein
MRRRDRVVRGDRLRQAVFLSDRWQAAPRTWRIWPSRHPDAGDLRRHIIPTPPDDASAHAGCTFGVVLATGPSRRPRRTLGGLPRMAVGRRSPMALGWLPAMAVARLRSTAGKSKPVFDDASRPGAVDRPVRSAGGRSRRTRRSFVFAASILLTILTTARGPLTRIFVNI